MPSRCGRHEGRLGDVPIASALGTPSTSPDLRCPHSLLTRCALCRAAWGGSDGRLATNPLSIATPGPERPLLLDITTSVVAEGKVRLKRNAGQPVPAGWLVDSRGEPTTDPQDLYNAPRGAILPFGGIAGHKGY